MLTILLLRQKNVNVVFWTLGSLRSVKIIVIAIKGNVILGTPLSNKKVCSRFPGPIYIECYFIVLYM
jgi:hypothetical protein